MAQDVEMIEVWRGNLLESVHRGHAVVCDGTGQIIHAWGDPQAVILPRSSAKMLQALPLVESGAADAFGLRTDQLALACASHIGASYHVERVTQWIADLGLTDDDFRCGPQLPDDSATRIHMAKTDQSPCQYHNNCSGKHSGFLTLTKHIGAGPEYVEPTHPVQLAVRAATEDVTGEDSPGVGIDGCSAPNFASSVHGIARAMAAFATAGTRSGARAAAQVRLTQAMALHPELVSGEGRACTELMRATNTLTAIKGGADGVYVAIVPDRQIGIALKITDGADRAKEAAIAAILIRLGLLDRDHPAARAVVNTQTRNRRGIVTGTVKASAALSGA
jgi:L-asparaginase II